MKAIAGNNGSGHQSIEQYVKNSELDRNINTFDYTLNDKTAKAKLLKAAQRQPIDIEENSTSSNLIFSAGAWIHVVFPVVKYWSEVKESKTCKIEDYEIEIAGVKENKETQGKHVNTKIVFLANRNKIVCHIGQIIAKYPNKIFTLVWIIPHMAIICLIIAITELHFVSCKNTK